MFTCAAIAALDRASSPPPCVLAGLSPRVRPGVFFQFVFCGTEARGAELGVGAVPTTRPGPAKDSGLFVEREQMLPMLFAGLLVRSRGEEGLGE